MKMEILFTAIRIPDFSKVYIFGSALISPHPNDLDVLIVYDERYCSPETAFDMHKQMIDDLESVSNIPIHVTMLSKGENSKAMFHKQINAVLLEKLKLQKPGF